MKTKKQKQRIKLYKINLSLIPNYLMLKDFPLLYKPKLQSSITINLLIIAIKIQNLCLQVATSLHYIILLYIFRT